MSVNSEIADKIIDKIFEETNRIIQMNITKMSDLGISSILTGLVGFFIAGYRNDFELSQEITPQYQKRIMPRVDRESYNNYTYQLNDSYTQFRECAIKHQNSSENWVSEMFDEFGEMLLKMLNANATQYSKNLMIDEAKRLLDIATKTDVNKSSINNEKTRTKDENKTEKKGSKLFKFVIGVLVVGAILVYLYINNVHSSAYPNGMYFMQEYIDNSEEHFDCYIKVQTNKDDHDNLGTFNIYLINYIDDSGEYYPRSCYMMSAPCGYWEWKTLLGSFAVNNAGKKYGIVPNGYERVDCYIADGKAVGFDSYFEPLDTSGDDLSHVIETIDFGTNNFIYQGTLYNKVNEANLDDDTRLYISILEKMMNDLDE